MATEEATVKLTLDSGNYVTAMKKVGAKCAMGSYHPFCSETEAAKAG